MLVGFFMLMIDTLIVSVANPSIQRELNTSLTATIWVTSAYMLAIAVPLLVAGRLGDRFGQKTVFMAGMALFTVASAACGLSGTITALIMARVVQGFGAALMTPQTQAMIVRLFPPDKRGAPMGVWGSVSGVAMLIAPLAGGFLLDHLGWQAIFLVNVPIGLIGLVLAGVFIPRLDGAPARFDWIGMILSGVGLFLLVFGLQEGSAHHWGRVWGPITIPMLVGTGVAFMAVFVIWEVKGTHCPLVPMRLFAHRDFAVSTAAISCVRFVSAAMPLPWLYFLQLGRGYSGQESAMVMLPSAVISGVLSPLVGAKLIHRLGSRVLVPVGSLVWAGGLWWLALLSTDSSALVPWAWVASAVLGVGNSLVWSPLSVAATAHLPLDEAGAGSSVYNTVGQIGSVVGAAGVTTWMNTRIAAELNRPPAPVVSDAVAAQLPHDFSTVELGDLADLLRIDPAVAQWFTGRFASAMGRGMWLPIAVCVLGAVIAVGLTGRARRS
jgi:EmrB/QacA subfamily drug resistance transporter